MAAIRGAVLEANRRRSLPGTSIAQVKINRPGSASQLHWLSKEITIRQVKLTFLQSMVDGCTTLGARTVERAHSLQSSERILAAENRSWGIPASGPD